MIFFTCELDFDGLPFFHKAIKGYEKILLILYYKLYTASLICLPLNWCCRYIKHKPLRQYFDRKMKATKTILDLTG